MSIKQVTAWQCEWCGSLYHLKALAEDCHPLLTWEESE